MEINCELQSGFGFSATGAEKYKCVVTSELEIKLPKSEIRSLTVVHERRKSVQDVWYLEVEQKLVEFIPRPLLGFFPKLSELTIRYCRLKEVSRNDFIGLETLDILNLNYNEIKSLPDDLFANMKMLRCIEISFNKLEDVNVKLLDSLNREKLLLFSLNVNPKINFCYKNHQQAATTWRSLVEAVRICKPTMLKVGDHKEKLQRLVTLGLQPDFVIRAESEEFKVHKSILLPQSSVFEAMLANDSLEAQTNEVKIEDFSASAIKDFVYFLYMGDVENSDNSYELFGLAEKYNIGNLKVLSEKLICDNLESSNVLAVFNLGIFHSSPKLRQSAFSEIARMLPDTEFQPEMMNDPRKLNKIVTKKVQKLMQVNSQLTL